MVRSEKNNRKNRIDDGVIPHFSSIHKALKEERRKQKAAIDKDIEKLQKSPQSSESERAKAKEELENTKLKIKGRRKVTTDCESDDGHTERPGFLRNRFQENGNQLFREFVTRAEEDHAVKNSTIPKLN
ncbi:hypothetical protein [Legionella worsleiensis]|uniref:Substrate of the Dot/Icm system n=1 Tax=Legionella worsleiensis TaxID=45076 RepID=A0A0W1A9I2_9GAMM|nr:hypothetical protein [Legionella worsleiensis]KTD77985.1 substrate of the Dot/Icm system [Legionella worsleiensis]STY31546.1 SidB [Legionella worsleiensis]